MTSSAFGFDTSTYAPGVNLGNAGLQPVGNSPFGMASGSYAPGVSIEKEKKKKKNKNEKKNKGNSKNKNQGEFPGETTTYASGASVGVPTEASAFVDEYITKKGRIKNKDMKAFREAGGDMSDLRDLFENQDSIVNQAAGIPSFDLNKRGLQALQDHSASMDYVATNKKGKPKIQSFIDEYANARGRITTKDMKAFQDAGGNLNKLRDKLEEGGFIRNEVKGIEENLNKRGTAIAAGNEDYYTGSKGKKFLTANTAGEDINVGTDDGNDGTNKGTPNVDPSSGFPFNPGRHDGEPFTEYRENIKEIKAENDDYIAEIQADNDFDADNSFTTKYVDGLIEAGVIAGGENYKTPLERDAERLSGDLAIKDAFDPDEMDTRMDRYSDAVADLGAEINALSGVDGGWSQIARDAYDHPGPPEGASDAVKADWTDTRLQWPTDARPTWVKESMDEAPAPKPKPEPKPEKETNEALPELMALPEQPTGKRYTFDVSGPGSKEVPMEAPDDFKKKPSFDGYKGYEGFQQFVKMATDPVALAEGENQGKARLYNALKDAGLTEEEMFKGAQYAGITNLRTDSDSIPEDVAAIKHAVDNDYYQGTVTVDAPGFKSEADLFQEYRKLGGTGKLATFQDRMKYGSYDSIKDAEKFANYLSNQLYDQGIYRNDKEMRMFNKDLRAIEDAYGGDNGRITKKDYKALVDQGYKRPELNEWMNDFRDLGGRMGKGLEDRLRGKTAEEAKADEQAGDLMGGGKGSSGVGKLPKNSYFENDFGQALLSPDKMFTTEVIDSDGDGIDDRYQAAPGMPTFKGDFEIRDVRKARTALGGNENRKALIDYMKQLQAAGITLSNPVLDQFKGLSQSS